MVVQAKALASKSSLAKVSKKPGRPKIVRQTTNALLTLMSKESKENVLHDYIEDRNAMGHPPDMVEILTLLQQKKDIFGEIDAKSLIEKNERLKQCVGQHSHIDTEKPYLKIKSKARELRNKKMPKPGYDYSPFRNTDFPFYTILRRCFETHKVKPGNIWAISFQKVNIEIDQINDHLYYHVQRPIQQKPWVKFIDGVNATGKRLQAYLSFLDDNIYQPEKPIPGFYLNYTSQSSEWESTGVFDNWLEKVFIPKAASSNYHKLLLINAIDAGNLSQKFFFTCFQNKIHIQFIQRSQEKQFNPMYSACYYPLLRPLSDFYISCAESKVNLLVSKVRALRSEAVYPEAIVEGFDKAGIYPFDEMKKMLMPILTPQLELGFRNELLTMDDGENDNDKIYGINYEDFTQYEDIFTFE